MASCNMPASDMSLNSLVLCVGPVGLNARQHNTVLLTCTSCYKVVATNGSLVESRP